MATITASLADDVERRPRDTIYPNDPIRIVVEPEQAGEYVYEWKLPPGASTDADLSGREAIVYFDRVEPGRYDIIVTIYQQEGEQLVVVEEARLTLEVLRPINRAYGVFAAQTDESATSATAFIGATRPTQPSAPTTSEVIPVSLQRPAVPFTPDIALWMLIRRNAKALSFEAYNREVEGLLCSNSGASSSTKEQQSKLSTRRFLPFTDTDAYRFLKCATEAFVLANVGVALDSSQSNNFFLEPELNEAMQRLGLSQIPVDKLGQYFPMVKTNGTEVRTLPYLALVYQKLRDVGIKRSLPDKGETNLPEECYGILEERLTKPVLIELIWSYWHEEGMLVQTMNAITRRFQNIRGPSERDPLAHLEIDPLRPLSNLLWGYVQDEQHRLSVVRRAYEYDHQYGISLTGKAVGSLRPADSRSKFLEGFHNLLHLCTIFYQQDDDTTVIADGFPLLNALREVHLELSRGAHNQFGDLPSTARQEMLMQQWLLARPEFREFLPTRVMVTYPESWMGPVDAMKQLQGWIDTSVIHFFYLAHYGEQILLSIRYGAWNDPNVQRDWAANWARFWRNEIQGYIHAYRTVTGVDLSVPLTGNRSSERYLPPSVHLNRRLAAQRRGVLPASEPALPLPPPRRRLPRG